MRYYTTLALLIASLVYCFAQGVTINNNGESINENAILDINSTELGLLIPRMSTAQRSNFAMDLSETESGMLVFDTEEEHFYFWIDGAFRRINLSTSIIDSDLDTEIRVEERLDDDIIRFYTKGVERWTIEGDRLEPQNDKGLVFIGKDAGLLSTSRTNNIAIGDSTLMTNGLGANLPSQGINLTALGHRTLRNNTTGSSNTGLGYNSLTTNSTGSTNTGLGAYTLQSNRSGSSNLAAGYKALMDNTIGDRNSAVGYYALLENIDGEDNTAFGYLALFNNESGIRNVGIGSRALQNNLGDRNVAVGNRSLVFNSTGFGNVGIGNAALYLNTNANGNVAIGDSSMANYNDYSFFGMVAIGNKSQQENRTGRDNTSVGSFALHDNRSGVSNTAVGNFALYLSRGDNSTAIGNRALGSTSSGDENTAVGSFALASNTSRNRRTAIGYSANSLGNNGNNTGLGNDADCTAAHQVRIGNDAVTSIGGYANWTNISDGKFKKNVNENVPGLSFITALRPVTYQLDTDAIHGFFLREYAEDKRKRYAEPSTSSTQVRTGFIAQEVEKIALQLGYDFSGVDAPKNDKDFYGLRYAAFVVPLVRAVQEQQVIIDDQDRELKQAIEKLDSLQDRLEKLEVAVKGSL